MSEILSQEFIQDFILEANEHLQRIGHYLLELDTTLQDSDLTGLLLAKVTAINELLRSYHTLKGLAGMVGLRPAEELSHASEAVLRAIQKAELELTQGVIDQLLSSTQTLQAVIAAIHAPMTLPDIRADLQGLEDLLASQGKHRTTERSGVESSETYPGPSSDLTTLWGSPGNILQSLPEVAQSLSPVEAQRIQAAIESGYHLALAIFTPNRERLQQGENVSVVREQLLQSAELIKAFPATYQGGITFQFLVASAQPLAPGDFISMEWVRLDSEASTVKPDVFQQPLPSSEPAPSTHENRAARLPSPATIPLPSLAPFVRIELSRLDTLMRLVSELVVDRSRVADVLPRLNGAQSSALASLEGAVGKMERHLRDLRQAVMRTRMVPLAEVFGLMPLAVRDLARASGKEVRLEIEGEQTEIDKYLVERLLDPMLHLVRNAIAHGLETPAERRQAGKPTQGVVRISGHPSGDQIEVRVADDGRGIDARRVIEQAVALGWLPANVTGVSNQELIEIICRPGLTTREEPDLGAGRGMGMNVVFRAITSMGGSLTLETAPEVGTTFILLLPLTLAIVDALIVRCGDMRYAVPQTAVDEVAEIEPAKILSVECGELYPWRKGSLTLVRLSDLFHLPGSTPAHFHYGLVSGLGEQRTALLVDGVEGLREVVVRTINDPLISVPGISGATELGDGSVILILDLPALFQVGRQNERV